jgi:exopolysaccharide biosynthesis polyprenyl glycosylphosphotransferase
MTVLTASGGPLTVEADVRPSAGGRRAWAPRLTKAATVAADVMAFCLAMAVAFRLKSSLPGRDASGAESRHLLVGVISLPVWVITFARHRLYLTRYLASRLDEFRRVVHATITAVGLIAAAAFMLKLYVARGWLVLTAVVTIGAVMGEREVIRRVFAWRRRQGGMLRPVVVVGANIEALALCSMLDADPTLACRAVGFVDDGAEIGAQLLEGRPVLGRVAEVVAVARSTGATGVIVATTAVDADVSNRLIREVTDAGLHVEMSSSLRDISPNRLVVRPLGRFPVVYVEPVRRHGWRGKAKRSLDVAVAGGALVLSAPVLLVAALAVRFTSRGPILFRQKRVGREGEVFELLKLRSMVDGAESLIVDLRRQNEADGPLFKIRNDPRVTRVGRLLRALSIDELPQFWNVIRGEMSLVGPRPALASEVDLWSPELHQRLRVKPGITGMWQVSGRSNASFEDYVRLDLYYVDNWSLWTDLAIVVKTIPTVLFQRGAY